jgi:hypothetical protein
LALSQTMAELHGGEVRIGNVDGGVKAVLELQVT